MTEEKKDIVSREPSPAHNAVRPSAHHTPGPWRLSRTERYVMDGVAAPWVCEVTPRAECRANARLIAAAPDLLEVAKAIAAAADALNGTVAGAGPLATMARAAIAKAEGQ